MAAAEQWAAGLPNPAYAIDDETAIKIVDDTVEVISRGTGSCSPTTRKRPTRAEQRARLSSWPLSVSGSVEVVHGALFRYPPRVAPF
jgi:hypothetical protein